VTLGGSGVVAHFALERARFTAGETVLVRGAAGSIGITAVQLAARGGANAVAVTTSSAERGARLRDLGATHVLDRSGESGPGTPAGFDVVIDVVAGPGLPLFLDKLSPSGRYVAVGVVGGQPPADFGMRLMNAFRRSFLWASPSRSTRR
jgi:NADPH:quinone reductase